jgi:hypothetical protein
MYKRYMYVLIGRYSTGESHTQFNDEETNRSSTCTWVLHSHREPGGPGNDRMQPSHLQHSNVEGGGGVVVGDHGARQLPVA